MSLVRIHESPLVKLEIAYATPDNVTGQVIYARPLCYLHAHAAAMLERAAHLAHGIGLGIKVFDAFRPSEAQWKLWEACPNPDYVADPSKGSPHTRGIAVDLTLVDAGGRALDMGTPFDHLGETSHHRNLEISAEAQRNRLILLGIMTAAGFDHYLHEWWHYQLFNPRDYPLLNDADLPESMMVKDAA